jgi:hypothetical protein
MMGKEKTGRERGKMWEGEEGPFERRRGFYFGLSGIISSSELDEASSSFPSSSALSS